MFKILVIEDDNDLKELFCKVLRRNHYHPIGVDCAEAALDVLDRPEAENLVRQYQWSRR